MATDEIELATDEAERSDIEAKYEGKVFFSEDDIEPLYTMYHAGTLMGQNGVVKAGSTLIKYTREKLYFGYVKEQM